MTRVVALVCSMLVALGLSFPNPNVKLTSATTPPERSAVYLFVSAGGWAADWQEYARTPAFVNPETNRIDMRRYYANLGATAREMNVDGVIITTPGITRNGLPAGTPDAWRYRMEGRKDALDAGVLDLVDRNAIVDGLVLMRLAFGGKIVLYTGYPDDRSPLGNNGSFQSALSLDTALVDGYIKCSLGPWLDSGMVDACIVDTVGAYWPRPVARKVCERIVKLYPRVRLGAEPHPVWFSGHPFVCSLTTYTVAQGGIFDRGWSQPRIPSFYPEFVAYTEPRVWDAERYADAITRLRAGYSVAVQPWTVGWRDGQKPDPAARAAWMAFVAEARSIRNGASNP